MLLCGLRSREVLNIHIADVNIRDPPPGLQRARTAIARYLVDPDVSERLAVLEAARGFILTTAASSGAGAAPCG